MKQNAVTAVAVGFAMLFAANISASAAEIRVIAANALKSAVEELGIADALKDKLLLLPPENPVALAVANGEAEIGMSQISEILPHGGAELLGPFPKEIQLTTSFATAVGAGSRQSEPAKALIKF